MISGAASLYLQGMWALAFLVFVTCIGEGRDSVQCSDIADKTSGLTAAYSVMAALYAREKNGGRGPLHMLALRMARQHSITHLVQKSRPKLLPGTL